VSYSGLDQFQQAAVTDARTTLFVSAPAGSGKTRVLIKRVEWLVERGLEPKKILVLTFARRAAKEIRERLHKQNFADVKAFTFHAWAYQLARSLHTHAFELITPDRRTLLLRRIFVSLLASQYGATIRSQAEALNWSLPFFVRETVSSIERMQQFGYGPQQLEAFDRSDSQNWPAQTVQIVWRLYDKLLKNHGACDFPQLITQATSILESGSVRRQRFQHVLVDEVQDASPDELRLLQKALSSDTAVTWIGDRRQAIYAWRGAIPFAVQAPVRELRVNYRSDANIISLVNDFCRNQVNQSIQASRSAIVTPTLVRHTRYYELSALDAVLTEVAQHGISSRDCLILARTNSTLSRVSAIARRWPGVTLLTVHAAKGLEARVVVVLGCSRERFGFPLPERTTQHPLDSFARYDRSAEEERLFYVALTRAKDQLILMGDIDNPSPYLKRFSRSKLRRVTLAELTY
jgi:DNA helicase-4